VSRTPQERLADIQESAARAQRAVDAMERARASRDDDEEVMAFDALLYRLLVIGEAVKALPPALLDLEQTVPWREIARLRDLLAHHYYRVDPQIIRRTVDTPLLDLRAAAHRLLLELPVGTVEADEPDP
jgi:uncharacterized protein with HEPN domain